MEEVSVGKADLPGIGEIGKGETAAELETQHSACHQTGKVGLVVEAGGAEVAEIAHLQACQDAPSLEMA